MKKVFLLLFLSALLLTGCQKEVFMVTFVDYNDVIITEVEVEAGQTVTPPANPIREGYTFTGWDESLENIQSSQIIKALYEINLFTVTFNDYDGTLLKTEDVPYHASATAPTEPTREGYTFIGWSIEFDDVVGNITVTAQYEVSTYLVTFMDGDVTLKIETLNHLESATAPEVPTKEGYTFEGWDTDFTSVTHHLTVHALFETIPYQVCFHGNNRMSTLSSTQWTTKEFFVEDSYTDFFNWLKDNAEFIPELTQSGSSYSLIKNGSTATWSDVSSLKAVDIYIFEKTLSNYIYAPIIRPSSDNEPVIPVVNNNYFLNTEPYRSKFIEMDAYFLNALIQSYSGYDRSYTPTAAGKIQIFFRFQQWVKGTSIAAFTHYNSYDRYDVVNFGSVILPENRVFTVDDATPLPLPAYVNVTFLGWFSNPKGAGLPITSLEGVAKNIDLYAFWDTDSANNTLQYFDMDGTLLKTESIATGETPTPPTITPQDGYVFMGWDKDFSSVTTNLTLTAVYSKISYTLTYDDNQPTLEIPVPETANYEADESIILVNITYDGYYFLGWYLDQEGTNRITQTTTGNIRVYAKWVKVASSGETIGDGTLEALIDDAVIEVGNSANVYAKTASGYVSSSEITYASSNEAVATVTQEGFVIGKQAGNVTILVARGTQLATIDLEISATRPTILWVGHQGSSGPYVQNTVDAFIGGATRGYYALECDVRVSKDGVYYICHDDTFLEYLFVDVTYHGKLMGGYNWSELSTLQIKDSFAGQTYYSTLSTVEAYLNVCKEYNVKAVLELKYTNGINSSDTSRLGGLVELVKQCGMYENAIFMTSMTACLNYLRTNHPDAQLQFLSGSSSTSVATAHWCVENRISLDAANDALTKEIIDILHEGGLYVNAYTVNNEITATTLYNLGVDMITTDSLGQNNG